MQTPGKLSLHERVTLTPAAADWLGVKVLARKIAWHGYRNVKIFFGGWREWTVNNQPTQP